MLCDDTIVLLNACVVCLETKKMIMKHRITSLQEPEYSLSIFTVSITQACTQLSNFSSFAADLLTYQCNFR